MTIVTDFGKAYIAGSGTSLAEVLTPIPTPSDPGRLRKFLGFTTSTQLTRDLNAHLFQFYGKIPRLPTVEQQSWLDIFAAYWEAVVKIVRYSDGHPSATAVGIFNAWKKVSNALIKGYSSGIPAWTLPCLYTVGKYLRIYAIKADVEAASQGPTASMGYGEDSAEVVKHENLEEAARVLNRMFTLCLSDRAPIDESRRWGIYNITNLLLKTYFKIDSIGLTKNLLRALKAQSHDLPALGAFPKSHIVTFEFYVGLINFLEENYVEAEEHLSFAWKMCPWDAPKNREMILLYLIPCHLVTTHTLPSKALLAPFPRLEKLFRPLSDCIRKGDLIKFDEAMAAGEAEFVKQRIYLPLERGRDIALRNLFRKVFIAGGFEENAPTVRRTRVPVAHFAAALRIGTPDANRTPIDTDEVECLLSNLIYKGLMKGYIARERGFLVLSKNNSAFPGTGV
ncbi:PCI/PINT associated module [Penicillium taxi]|uniref:PCI/PINT associated module n=1 Tax=Penicillium taxi TaxID=168475 RepID=UPI002544F672|nr:PCI/PINT associated module [Penicillium taxi]KAJ5893391.1 PCI/PINT associated module [Penicillium taxi]